MPVPLPCRVSKLVMSVQGVVTGVKPVPPDIIIAEKFSLLYKSIDL